MAVNNEFNRETVPTRLSFKASDELDSALKDFLDPDVKNELNKRRRRFSLFSQQVAYLAINQGVYENPQDVIANQKYENAVWSLHHSHISLNPDLEINTYDRYMEFVFGLALKTEDRRLLVNPPLFIPPYDGQVKIYTHVPTERMGSGLAFNVARTKLETKLGMQFASYMTGIDHLYVTDASIFHRWARPKISPTSVDEADKAS